jgi:3-phenylpropionate/cinnamic acid dioxygenase small subunit
VSDRAGAELAHAIEQFLYDEAWLLDERRFAEWLALFTDDARYRMPTRRTVAKAAVHARVAVPEELSSEGQLAWFEDTKQTLTIRVMRLANGIAWAEDPPSRTRRVVTNVRVEPGEGVGEHRVRSYFVLHRTRHAVERETFVGCRHDLLRRVDGDLRIARRTIVLDETVLRSPNLSVFF